MSFLRAQAVRIVSLLLLAVLYAMTKLPEASEQERSDLAARFAFTSSALPVVTASTRDVRPVHPVYEHISGWISTVGAAVALADLDGDGLPNDVCYVDVRSDEVVIAPVPGTGDRYPPLALALDAVPYESAWMAPMGCVPSDLNEDGRTDVLVYYWGRSPVAFLRRGGNPASIASADDFAACELVPGGAIWNTNAATVADVDGDGHLDVVVGNYFPDGARVLDANATRVETEAMQHSMSRAFNAGVNHVLRWIEAESGDQPSVRYEDVVPFEPDVAHGWTLAVGACDLDGDQLPELYFGNDFGPDRLLHNRSTPGRIELALTEGRKTMATPGSNALGHDSFKGMGVDFGDVNGDGLFDVFVSNIADDFALHETHFLWQNTGDTQALAEGRAPFVQRSEPWGLSRSDWGWDSRLADFDNDGLAEALQATGFLEGTVNRWAELQELAMGNDELLAKPWIWPRFQPGDDLSGHAHNPFYTQRNGRYVDIAAELGLDAPQVTRGIAIADVDADGDLDFAIANQWDTSWFYRNEAPSPGAFVGIALLHPLRAGEVGQLEISAGCVAREGRPAVGAQGRITLDDGRVLVSQVDGGNGHSGVRAPALHFGLGDHRRPVKVELAWRDPDGSPHTAVVELEPGWHTIRLPWIDARRAGL